jgi:hypothetical protein
MRNLGLQFPGNLVPGKGDCPPERWRGKACVAIERKKKSLVSACRN